MWEQFFLILALMGCMILLYRRLLVRRTNACHNEQCAQTEKMPLIQLTGLTQRRNE
jgi:hypothetical protein